MTRVDLTDHVAELKVVLCCGSGGVGKTTSAAALGVAMVHAYDRRVMVLTVDPARRLATALGMEQVGAEPYPVPESRLRQAGVLPRGQLVVAMLDQKAAWNRLIERHAPDRVIAQRILGNRFYAGISDAFAGSHEYMAVETLYELHTGGEYDCVIVDTPPSRDAMDLLEAPQRLSDFVGVRLLSWLSGPTRLGLRAANLATAPLLRMADRLVGTDVLGELGDFVRDLQRLQAGMRERAGQVQALLRSRASGVILVTSPEPAAAAEAEFLATRLRQERMALRGLIMNRVLPHVFLDADATRVALDMAEGRGPCRAGGRAFMLQHRLAARDARQLARLDRFPGIPVVRVPAFADDLADLEGVARVARVLTGQWH